MTRRVTLTADQGAGGTSAQVAAHLKGRRSQSPEAQPRDILFDPQKRAAAPDLKACIKVFAADLEAQERQLDLRARQRSGKQWTAFRAAVEALACNLAWLLMAAPGRALGVPRDNNFMRGKSRYKPEVYGPAFIDVLDLMARPEVGLIENVQRGFKVGSRSQPSLIRPLPAFADRIRVETLTWESFIRLPPREVLILKSAKDAEGDSNAIDYEDTARTRQMRKAVVRLNAALQATPIILAVPQGEVLLDNEGLPIDTTKRALRRIFNNESWKEGGRLFGGFWETMPRKMRFRHLRFATPDHPEGESIANVDFEQLFPHLAYHHVGTEPIEGDLYDIEGDGLNRKGWKQLLNAQLFAQHPLRTWPRGCREAFERPMPFRQACDMLEERHRPIAHLFGKGIGFRFMLMESTALIEALGYLHVEGIPALPLHDSVLVPQSRAGRARELLQVALERNTGKARAPVSIDKAIDVQGVLPSKTP